MILSWLQDLAQMAHPQKKYAKAGTRGRLPRKLRYAARVEQWEYRLVPADSTNLLLNLGAAATPLATIQAGRSTTVPVFIDAGTLTGGAGGVRAGTFYLDFD